MNEVIEFQKNVYKKYKKFINNSKKSFNEYCFPKIFAKQSQQIFVGEFMNSLKRNSLLVYHKIGAGKTCAAISIAEKWKNKRNIFFIVPAALITNVYKELMGFCGEYATENERKIMNQSKDKKIIGDIYSNVIDRINEYYNIYSIHKFVENIKKININNSILIIDEVHNITNDNGLFFNTIFNKIKNAKNIKIIAMTATPIYDKPSDLASIIKLLNPNSDIEMGNKFNDKYINDSGNLVNKDDLINYLNGIVSFYPGAPEYTFPSYEIKIINCKMSQFQSSLYLTVQEKELKNKKINLKSKGLINAPNNFFISSRILSNIAFPNGKLGKKGYLSLKKSHVNNLEKYSAKFSKLLKKIKKKGNIFIYSSFKEYGCIKPLKLLLDYSGYKDFKIYGPGKKRYAIWSSDDNQNYKNIVRDTFNNIDNSYGNNLKIIIGSPSIKEGVSLFRVRQVHIIDPYWNWSRLDQIIGRSIRFCSHKDMPKDERNVKVYIYLAIPYVNLKMYKPKDKTLDGETIKETSSKENSFNEHLSVDKYILEISNQKKNTISQFESLLKTIAIDKLLYK